jgi:hypothetical protein
MNPPPEPLRPVASIAAGAALLVLLAGSADVARGLIDPKFTPVHVVAASTLILTGNLEPGETGEPWQLKRVEVLKGDKAQAPGGAAFSLANADADQREPLRSILAEKGDKPALLFRSRRNDEKGLAYLHVADQWLEVQPTGQDRWNILRIARQMSGAYAGGSDMLVRMTRYILADRAATVPVSARIGWMQEKARLGKVDGPVAGMQALQLGGQTAYLFVASTSGDRLYQARRNDEVFEEVTAQARLDTRSRRFAWMDLDRDGQLELISWNGKAIMVRKAADNATFKPFGQDLEFGKEVLGLAACSLPDGSPAALVSTAGLPILLSRDDRKWRTQDLPGGDSIALAGRARMACIAADLDNDGYWDVLQPRENGGVLWRGGPTGLARPVRCDVTNPDTGAHFALGDFDQDGYLDLFIGGENKFELWENDRKANFRPVARSAGSLGYKARAGLSGCCAADLNHDGRPDLCLLYPNAELAYHFSRGFRCFGEEGDVTLAGLPSPGPAASGQLACAVADFNGDGSQDLAVALADGEVYCFYNGAYSRPMMSVGLKKATGPITVSVWQGEPAWCMGTATVHGPQPKACFALRGNGPANIRWRSPGRPEQTRKVDVPEPPPDGGVEVILEP